jgi:TRAP-type C4-dicarboxylate transport system substrate-binding protein
MKKLTALALAAAALASGAAQAATILTVSSWVPPKHLLSVAQADWCKELTKRTEKRVRCNILPKAPMNAPGTLDGVKKGLVDVSFIVHGYTPGRFTATKMAEMSFLGDSATTTSVAYHRVASGDPAFQAEADKEEVKVLAYFTHGPGMILNTKREINSVGSMQGLKFRIGGGLIGDITKALDVNTSLKPAPASYELLSTGVMDGTFFPAESADSFKLVKLLTNATTIPGGLYNTSFAFLMNPSTYNKLDPQDRKIVDEMSGEFAAKHFGGYWDRADDKAMKSMADSGVKMTKASAAFVQDITVRTSKIERDWVAEAKAAGMQDPAGALAAFRAEIAKLQK